MQNEIRLTRFHGKHDAAFSYRNFLETVACFNGSRVGNVYTSESFDRRFAAARICRLTFLHSEIYSWAKLLARKRGEEFLWSASFEYFNASRGPLISCCLLKACLVPLSEIHRACDCQFIRYAIKSLSFDRRDRRNNSGTNEFNIAALPVDMILRGQ